MHNPLKIIQSEPPPCPSTPSRSLNQPLSLRAEFQSIFHCPTRVCLYFILRRLKQSTRSSVPLCAGGSLLGFHLATRTDPPISICQVAVGRGAADGGDKVGGKAGSVPLRVAQ